MFRNIVSPVQAWLLSQGRCVGCGTSLKKAKVRDRKADGQELVTCKCGRVYVYDLTSKKYRRALLSEV
jgi:hypothetical protein